MLFIFGTYRIKHARLRLITYASFFPTMALDLSVIIVYYRTVEEKLAGYQGFGFFPRTEAKAKEFGIDLKKHTHLFLGTPKPLPWPPRVVISPDGKYIVLTETRLPPRIWEVEHLAKTLKAENAVKK